MKKLLVLVCSISVVLCFMITPVSAASTVFVDKADSEFTKVTTKVGVWQFEDNLDVEKTLYSKGMGSKDLEISLVYKMDGTITAFKVDTLNCSGLGDSTLDVAAYVSQNGTSWTKIETSVTDQVMDPAYISTDIAYWFNSAVSNKNAIPANITYLKISLMPFTRENMVGWSTVLDDIYITYDAKAAPTPTKPASSAPASSTPASSSVSAAESSEASSTEISSAADSSEAASIESEDASSEAGSSAASSEAAVSSSASDTDGGGSNTPIIIGAIVLGVLVLGAIAYFVFRRKR
ncbi:MAG: hypothetical protein ACYCYM_08925 [Saccharofermentanales bacterium]